MVKTIPPGLTHYDILDLTPSASLMDIRAAYVRLVKIYHPDRAPPAHRAAAVVMFQAITEAYATLKKPHLRAEYDRSLTGRDDSIPLNDNRLSGSVWSGLREIFR